MAGVSPSPYLGAAHRSPLPWGQDAAEHPQRPRGTGAQAAEQVAAHAASPTCCPVPSYNELVRPCYCHRTQMSAGQPSPAPRFARVCSSHSLRVAGGAVSRSIPLFRGTFAWVFSRTVSFLCTHLLLLFVVTTAFSTLQDF